MKLLINTASTLKGGGLQVAASFIEDCKAHPENEYHVVLGFMLAKSIKPQDFPSNFHFYTIGYRPATRVFSFKSHDKFFKKIEAAVKPDVVFTTTGPAYWRPKAPHVIGFNLPHHVYPESPYMTQRINLYRKLRWKVKRALVKFFFTRDADCIVVQTDDVKLRLQNFLGVNDIITVSNTYNPYYNNPEIVAPKLLGRQPGEFRLLMLSAWYPHKNFIILPQVAEVLIKRGIHNIRFVLTLPQELFEQQIPAAYREYFYNTGPVKLKESPSLYYECDAMFLPTLLECFSASYAEAMVTGKPIITSNMGFATTVCGDAAVYFDPVDATDIADKIMSVATNPQLQQVLVNKGKMQMANFGTSQQRTQEYLQICSTVKR